MDDESGVRKMSKVVTVIKVGSIGNGRGFMLGVPQSPIASSSTTIFKEQKRKEEKMPKPYIFQDTQST